MRYLNEHGEEISMPFVCNHNEPRAPAGTDLRAGPEAWQGVQRLGSKQLQAALWELFTKVQNQLTDDVIKKILDPSARKRAEDVRALSDYYLGRCCTTAKGWVEAHSHFAAFRQSQHDKGARQTPTRCEGKRDFLQAEKLGDSKFDWRTVTRSARPSRSGVCQGIGPSESIWARANRPNARP